MPCGKVIVGTSLTKPETIQLGERTTFAVESDLHSPYRYTWLKNRIPIPGAGSQKTFTTLPLTKEDFNVPFSCIVYSVQGSETSNEIVLEPAEAKKKEK